MCKSRDLTTDVLILKFEEPTEKEDTKPQKANTIQREKISKFAVPNDEAPLTLMHAGRVSCKSSTLRSEAQQHAASDKEDIAYSETELEDHKVAIP